MLRPTDLPALILSDGSLPSLVACAIVAAARRPEQSQAPSHVLPAALPAPSPTPAPAPAHLSDRQRATALHQAALYGLSPIQAVPPRGTPSAFLPGEPDSRLLVDAAYTALHLSCRTLVSPALACEPGRAPDVPSITRLVDRCLLVSRLASLDAPEAGLPEIRVEPLFADLDDDAIADLAMDLDCPVDTCWWFADPAPQAERERSRWLPRLERLGFAPSAAASHARSAGSAIVA